MSTAFAMLLALLASAAASPAAPPSPGSQAHMAQAYMRLVDAANDFELEEAIAARAALLERHGASLNRIGPSSELTSLMALGRSFRARQIDWWQGRMPEKDARYLVVWWHPNHPDSRRVVLGAQAIGAQHDLPVLAMVAGGSAIDRKHSAGVIAICPDVTFAAAPHRILNGVDLTAPPMITVVEGGAVLWHGTWEGLRKTPLGP